MEYEKNLTIADNSRATLSVVVKKDVVNSEYDALLLKYSKELALPGFRRGKVPVSVLKAKYSSIIQADLMNNIIDVVLKEVFEELPKEEKPLAVCQPEVVGEPKIELGADFSFSVCYDVSPKVEILKDEGFVIKTPIISFSEEDVNREIEMLRERNAVVKEKGDGAIAEKGDLVTIDYKILDGENKDVCIDDYVFTIGSHDSVYMFDDDIVGMKKGEKKEISKVYDQDCATEHLRGKTLKIEIKLKAVKERILPEVNDDLAQDISEEYKSVSDLKNAINERLQRDVDSLMIDRKKELLIVELLKANPVNIPESMSMYRLASRLSDISRVHGIPMAELQKNISSNREEYLNRVLAPIIAELHSEVLLDKLKEKYEISLNDDELMAYFENAKPALGVSMDILKKEMADANRKEGLRYIAEKEKLLELLMSKSTFEEGEKVSLNEAITS